MKLITLSSIPAAILSLLVFATSCEDKPILKKSSDGKKAAVTAKAETKITEVSSAEAKKRLADGSGVVVIDVRTPGEFAAGHIEGAKNIDFMAPDFAKKVQALDRNKTYLVHCQSGGRSGSSKKVFKKLGFKNILHLSNGFGEWKASGNKVVK